MKSILATNGPNVGGAEDLTPGNSYYATLGNSAFNNNATDETIRESTIDFDGAISRLSIRISGNTLSTATVTATLRVNGVSTALTTGAIAAGATGLFEDTSNSVAVSVGDTISILIQVSAGGTGAAQSEGISVLNENDVEAEYAWLQIAAGNANSSQNSTTGYGGFSGNNWSQGTTTAESAITFTPDIDLVASYYQVHVGTNGRSSASTGSIRKNAANGASNVSVGAGLTGQFTDTSNSDSFTANTDTINGAFSTGAGTIASIFPQNMGVNCTSEDGFILMATFNGNTWNRAASATPDSQTISGFLSNDTSANNNNTQVKFSSEGSNFKVRVITNTCSSAVTARMVKNGVASNQTVTIPAGTTGYFEDTTNTDTYADDDLISFEVVGGTSGSLSFHTASMVMVETEPPPPVTGGNNAIRSKLLLRMGLTKQLH